MIEFILLFIMGLLGGFLAGLIGVGGGVIYILILPYVLLNMGYPDTEIVQFTIANSLVGTMFAALSGNVALIMKKEFFWKEVLIVGLFGIFISLLVLQFVVQTDWYQRDKFNVVIILLMSFVVFRTLKSNRASNFESEEKQATKGQLGVVGALAGSISALSGLGGGVVIIPILNLRFKQSMRKAKSISLGVIFITSMVMSISNLLAKPMTNINGQNIGYVVWPLVLVLSLGVIIGSPYGVRIARKLSNRTISYIFVSFLGVVIIDKLIQLLS
ncbi:sulfite exporter TauE/SafE family protein [uncultured Roseivirga sp.]|uniref:sulfite exporter TauE/SafE family protein n=1 Tax=uncultured Roseivirga sp. TaxID=543088 RepID=UPI0030DC94D9|tara:strand:- start:1169 stop:1984 length:816 start_codon:yes stop_codon:yes gene_type:complete